MFHCKACPLPVPRLDIGCDLIPGGGPNEANPDRFFDWQGHGFRILHLIAEGSLQEFTNSLEDTDLVEDPKYVGDASFMADMPDKYRVDPESKELLGIIEVSN